jgi:small-conductance mechanosensitive channel
VPNETVIKTEVTNLTRFPARRVDIKITVSYKENLKKVQELLIKIAEEEPKL